ncbi:MAG TPA: DUF2975 domain-containing protein [Ferruginibacter sp.]|nr:DUF2975 domain-containing protein [Ferruginibacter sp.]HMP20243.1 DUF2975 domain-containing protein [Ferruginibacter sp.]
MEIKITSQRLMKVLQVLSWIIFIGLCIEAGGILVNTCIAVFIQPRAAQNFWAGGNNLYGLLQFDKGYFIVICIIMLITGILKAIMFYLIVQLFTEKKLNIAEPFTAALGSFMTRLSYLSLGIGFFAYMGTQYTTWLKQQAVSTANIQSSYFAGADVWLFMAVILFVLTHIIKRGIEIKTENDLTI